MSENLRGIAIRGSVALSIAAVNAVINEFKLGHYLCEYRITQSGISHSVKPPRENESEIASSVRVSGKTNQGAIIEAVCIVVYKEKHKGGSDQYSRIVVEFPKTREMCDCIFTKNGIDVRPLVTA